MRVTRKTYIVVLILSLLIVDESSTSFIQPASANLLFLIPRLLFRFLNFRSISNAFNRLRSFLRANGGRIRIGDVFDGISKIKDYFELLGYLNSTLNSNFTDVFTVELESAIEKFQKTFHLNITGQPDNDTVSLITLPRCGVPDFMNGTTTSFTKWWPKEKKELTYAFSPENDTTSSLKDVFEDAFRRWSNVTNLTFSETTSFNEADIQIMFLSLDGELGVVGGLWMNNTTESREIVLDSDETWVLLPEDTTESDDVDLETVVMHQIGHVLGLSHTAVEEAIMYPFIVPTRKRKVDFANDDLEKIHKLYTT